MQQAYFRYYPQLKPNLTAVSDLIGDRLTVRYAQLEPALQQMAQQGGKFMRPAFLLLFAGLHEHPVTEQQLKAAASIEILHMATLIHDDIIDDAPKRRGHASLQAAFGKDVAVYAGDYLFTVFFDLITETVANTRFLTVNARIMKRILNGELGQMGDRFKLDQSLLGYLRNVNGKTAALFSLAAEEGAFLGGATQKEIQLAKRIGQNIGIAFQILDDILDYTGHHLNKPILKDLATGVYSLPLLLVLPTHQAELTPYLTQQAQMTPADIKAVQQIVKQAGGVQAAQTLAAKFTAKAEAELAQLPPSASRRALQKIIEQLLKRTR